MVFTRKYVINVFTLLFIILLTVRADLYAQDYRFDRMSLEEGLSQSSVYTIVQDDKGFIWIGTQDGLNRYDGYTFKVFKSESENKNSLSSNYINTLYVDNHGFLWIGTSGGGLNRLNLKTSEFTHYTYDEEDSLSISDNYVRSIKEDNKGNLWIGTYNGGLNKFDQKTNKFIRFKHDPKNSNSLSNDQISDLDFDKNGILWIATEGGGLNLFNPQTQKFKQFNKDNSAFSTNYILSVFCDKDNVLWIGTEGEGLYRYSQEDNTFSNYKYSSTDSKSISSNAVESIYQDRDNILWIATKGEGLNRFDPEKKEFNSYKFEQGDENSLSSNEVREVFQDKYGVYWVGTYGGGLNKFNPSQNKFTHFKNEPGNINSLSHNQVDALYKKEHGNLWIGSYGGGVSVLNEKTGQFKRYTADQKNMRSISSNVIRGISSDNKGNYWVGTYGHGLNKFDPKTEKFTNFVNKEGDSSSLSFNKIRVIVRDKVGKIWIATFGGGVNQLLDDGKGNYSFKQYHHLVKNDNSISGEFIMTLMVDKSDNLWISSFGKGLDVLDSKRETYIHYRFNPTDKNSISSNNVLCIYEANNGIIWVGTFGGGFNSIDRLTGEIMRYTTKDGLSNDVVYGILEDEKGNLWMSTNKGLSVFNPKSKEFRNYTVQDGLQSDEFNSGAFFKDNTGKMYFGGINGLNAFYPWEVKDDPIFPDIVFTGFYISNNEVLIKSKNDKTENENEGFFIDQEISYTDHITLSHENSVFSIEFSALQFSVPDQNKYAYRMGNFEKEWNYVSAERRYVTYTNLNPGVYNFHIKASNSDGVWNEEGIVLEIRITPPFWRTIWFYFLCVIGFISIILMIFRVRIRRVRLEAENLRIEDQKEYFRKQDEGKSMMIKEIHHRVKNNLQVVNSLLRLQSHQIEDEKIVEMFEEAQHRVISMSMLHEKIYQSADLENIDIEAHFTKLINELVRDYEVGVHITLDIKIDKVDLGIKTLVPLGLIINEMITNSLKYAFKDMTDGVIKVYLKHIEGLKYELIIGDNGHGMTLEKVDKPQSLGTELIEVFTEQLNGEIERLDEAGTVFRIEFEKLDKN